MCMGSIFSVAEFPPTSSAFSHFCQKAYLSRWVNWSNQISSNPFWGVECVSDHELSNLSFCDFVWGVEYVLDHELGNLSLCNSFWEAISLHSLSDCCLFRPFMDLDDHDCRLCLFCWPSSWLCFNWISDVHHVLSIGYLLGCCGYQVP
jgi:hypothetical protein